MVLILITQDNGFAELIEELMAKGVRVLVLSPQTYNNKLMEKVGQTNIIRWSPVILDQPKRALKNQNIGWGMR